MSVSDSEKSHCALFYMFLVTNWISCSSRFTLSRPFLNSQSIHKWLARDKKGALYVEPLNVPVAVRAGDDYTLQCRYSLLPDQTLYAIRWYRDDAEIVRYMPKETPPHLVHNKVITDIEIDVMFAHSTGHSAVV